MEHLKIEEQINLWASADVVITPHGAALAHIIWMKQNSAIIELFPYKFHFNMYYKIAKILGIRYFNLPSTEGFTTEFTAPYDCTALPKDECLATVNEHSDPCCRNYMKQGKMSVNIDNLRRKLVIALTGSDAVCKFKNIANDYAPFDCI